MKDSLSEAFAQTMSWFVFSDRVLYVGQQWGTYTFCFSYARVSNIGWRAGNVCYKCAFRKTATPVLLLL